MTPPSLTEARSQDFVVTTASPPAPEADCAANFPIDQVMEMARSLRPDQKPGVRLVAGKPWTYDANLLLSYEARDLVEKWLASGLAPSVASDEGLDALFSAAMRRSADTSGREPATEALAERVAAERHARVTIPVLEPVTATVRQLDPAIWGQAIEAAE